MMSIIFALLAGALVIVCISLNGKLATKVGLIQSGITNYFMGLMASILYLLVLRGLTGSAILPATLNVPFYCFLGGVVGSVIMVLNSFVIQRLSAVSVTILLFLGQLLAGLLIDFFCSGQLSSMRIIGGLLVIFGLYVYLKGENIVNGKEAHP